MEVEVHLRKLMTGMGFRGKGGVYLGESGHPQLTRRVAFGHVSFDGDGVYKVQPFVGLRWDALEELHAAWFGNQPKAAATTPTLITNPGYLGPDKTYATYPFPSLDGLEVRTAEMVRDVLARGEDLWRRYRDPLLVLEALKSASPFVVPADNGRRLPLAYHLLGRDDEALALLPALQDEVGAAEGPWADAMKVFIDRLANALTERKPPAV